MQLPEVNILSTRPLDQSLIIKAAEKNIIIEALSFIETMPVTADEVIQQIRDLSCTSSTVAFTSVNAAEAVLAQLNGLQPSWKIFCLGSATKELISKYFPLDLLAGTAGNAALLADEIVKLNPSSVVFFCGDQRRAELPEKLVANNIALKEVVVYKTTLTPKKMSRDYEGILFFSPSAAESFFSLNNLPSHTVLFAIGDTTAGYLRLRCSNQVISGVSPTRENLLDNVMNYFNTSNHTHARIKK